MRFARLDISNVRIIESAALEPNAALNVLLGQNGCGKTSVLESIYLLSAGKSFRTGRVGEVIRRSATDARVVGRLVGEDGKSRTVGVERGGSKFKARIDGEDVPSAGALAREVPVIAMSPDSQRIYTDGAEERRKVVDWVMFHVEPTYGRIHGEYRKCVKQRNALLRAREHRGLDIWDEAVSESGTRLHALRLEHVEAIETGLSEVLSGLLQKQVDIGFNAGFDVEQGLLAGVQGARGRDEALGYTGVGPHRCDLELTQAGRPVQGVLSRGEGKMLAASLLMAQGQYLESIRGIRPVVLVDDLAAELDEDNRVRLMSYLQSRGWQALLSTVDEAFVEEALQFDAKVFHVKQGQVSVLLE